MIKRLLLILTFVNLHFFSFATESENIPEGRFSPTWDTTQFPVSIGFGEHLNESVSPVTNWAYSFPVTVMSTEKYYKLGVYYDYFVVTPTILESFINNQAAGSDEIADVTYNYRVRNENVIGFKFRIPSDYISDRLSLYLGPYSNLDWRIEYFPEISNIMLQPYINVNLGGALSAMYAIDSAFKFGLNLESSIVGFDTGRRGYNGDYLSDINLVHWGNYLDLDVELFYELTFSSSESLKFFYCHQVQSLHGGEHKTIQGENYIGIVYSRRLTK